MAVRQHISQRVSIVGWGSVSPLGCDAEVNLAKRAGWALWHQLPDGWLERRPAGTNFEMRTRYRHRIPEPLLRRRSDRCAQLGLLAAREAWAMASAAIGAIDPARVAVVLGTGIGGLHTMHEQHNQLTEGDPTRVNPLTVPMLIPVRPQARSPSIWACMVERTPLSRPAPQGAGAMMLAQMLLNDGRSRSRAGRRHRSASEPAWACRLSPCGPSPAETMPPSKRPGPTAKTGTDLCSRRGQVFWR